MEENRPDSLPHFEAAFDIVALAASAGGLMALSTVLSGLPAFAARSVTAE
jgi:two-component system chemotaxis response regulator CheB